MTSLLRLTLTNFRNYNRLVWSPKAQKTIVYGANGSGKTNLLEALSLLVPGRGLRKSRVEDLGMIGHQHQGWGIVGQFTHPVMDDFEIATGCTPNTNKKQFRLNEMPVRNQHEISQYLSAVWLTPQMDRLFSESAGGRRRFLDRLIITIEHFHTKEVFAYEKSMSQRNKLLALNNFDPDWLNAIEESMARHAVAITATRIFFIQQMNETTIVEGNFPEALLKLQCPIADHLSKEPALSVEDFLRQKWKKDRLSDAENKSTNFGVHRTDVLFIEKKTQTPANLASTGQQKALLVGIILKLTELIKSQNINLPILLLDEPLVHLDENHRKTLLATLMNLDSFTILTGTDRASFEQCARQAEFLEINHGNIM
ncbi:Recombinational DNA repair ATPase RecF (RecF) (PDB:5Z67) [Commensalibacter communis]|uniref:DNA replication and repair protein RecF n=1 Tax=Commensalibacter communis TaxID=2972786 RepID=A0A9W4X645_9PROT|nr:DNA replication/repair protein RecF [Commensalibacter communis]CAI3927980.1 Recombinational DNA repair ATPase RecF (RecF) (PDB:5Z67) [Commensalibacter communis]CAI3928554.1 Recombinational DNA repair ATPase RecF (RecF) (PDB:5Z67) [Commensalibacter communis]CAI3932892.1 Recombinational DNA repair ATPase RecF (RecF) (PDB:5Z67) [Commensalibacter communis]CAI3934445.1 Recombinational DNA repair ATPase RecF (RecF) (PDB:5Z67) [Commensalibacter communis]